MKITKTITIVTALLLCVSFTACKKSGCTDIDATNYDDNAGKDDGTCMFEGSVVFWYGETTSQGLLNDGATSLKFYLDGELVGSSDASVYWTGSPDCGDNSSITVTKALGGVETQSYSYSIKDQTDFEYWAGTVNVNGGTCTALELPW